MDENQREQEIFRAALELGTPEARRGFVLGACGPDQELQQKVQSLLSAHFASQSYIPTGYSPPTAPREQATGPSEGPGTVLGRYQLLARLKLTGRPRRHTPESLLRVLGDQSLSTVEWQKLAQTQSGIPKSTFYNLLPQVRKFKLAIESKVSRRWQMGCTDKSGNSGNSENQLSGLPDQ